MSVVELNTLAMVLPYVSLRTSAVLEEEEEDDPRKTQVAAHQAKETRSDGEPERHGCSWSQAACVLVVQCREQGRANRSIPRSSTWHPSGAGL
uniref:Uncharacterized protein n=1 Tax=Oryza nivara TaxID=4536 RepID=A0A0E0FL72_ORYNI